MEKLEWEEKYSVGVKEIDDQHKKLFEVINELLDLIKTGNTNQAHPEKVIESILDYKTKHFDTEEKYFKEFNYEGAEEHKAKHKEFNDKMTSLRQKHPVSTPAFAFDLIDFLEDWLLNHLLDMDQKYKECFQSHGLK